MGYKMILESNGTTKYCSGEDWNGACQFTDVADDAAVVKVNFSKVNYGVVTYNDSLIGYEYDYKNGDYRFMASYSTYNTYRYFINPTLVTKFGKWMYRCRPMGVSRRGKSFHYTKA